MQLGSGCAGAVLVRSRRRWSGSGSSDSCCVVLPKLSDLVHGPWSSDRGLWSLLLPRTDFHGSWSAPDLRSMVLGFWLGHGSGDRITDRDPLLGWNCCSSGLGVLEPFWSDPGDVGVARAPRTLAVLCCLSSRILSAGLGLRTEACGHCSCLGPISMDRGLPQTYGPWFLVSGSGMGPGIGSRIAIPCSGGIVAARVWVCWSRSGPIQETLEWLGLLGLLLCCAA